MVAGQKTNRQTILRHWLASKKTCKQKGWLRLVCPGLGQSVQNQDTQDITYGPRETEVRNQPKTRESISHGGQPGGGGSPVFFELVPEGADADAETLGGLGAVLPAPFEHLEDVLLLDLGQAFRDLR